MPTPLDGLPLAAQLKCCVFGEAPWSSPRMFGVVCRMLNVSKRLADTVDQMEYLSEFFAPAMRVKCLTEANEFERIKQTLEQGRRLVYEEGYDLLYIWWHGKELPQ